MGNKYALLTLPLTHARNTISAELGDGYVATERLPVGVPDHWQKWVGSLQYEAIVDAAYYLIVHSPARAPHVLDEENQNLRANVLLFHTGLTISVPNIGHEEAIYLTGAVHDNETDVREFTSYPQTFYMEGAQQSDISLPRLRAAKRIGLAIASFDSTQRMERLPRILTAFRTAHQAQQLDTRVHQFVRVIEGFVLPKSASKADEFADRLSELVSGINVEDLKQLYTIRSTVEHLRGPEVALRGAKKERRALLIIRAMQAEALARYVLGYFLDTPDLWAYFSTYKATRAFWNRSASEKDSIWPGKMDLGRVTSDYKLPDQFWDTEIDDE